jgi:glycosyltransferase involved in cell wall biosynthesis
MMQPPAPGSGQAVSARLTTTVVIPTYNSSATLPRALASIEGARGEVEILVVDDASDDAGVLQSIAAADPRVAIVAKPHRTNAADSRAIGLARAVGDIVLFLDSDDYYLPGHLTRRCVLHAAGQAGVVIGRFRLTDGSREWDGPMAVYDGGGIEDYLFARGGDARSSTISVDRRALRGTTFDVRQVKHQDWGFALAACRNGERIIFDPHPGVMISIAGRGRMSARSNVEASLAFARDQIRHEDNRRRFLLRRLRTSLRIRDLDAAVRFRSALLQCAPTFRDRCGSGAMLLLGRAGLAAPLYRLLTARR